MPVTESATPSREDFTALLNESFTADSLMEGGVIKGTIVAIEKDLAVIDVGLKTEGRVALKEFAVPGREVDLKVPLVVRLEGTNVAQGKQILADSGLPIVAANDLGDAAKKIVAEVRQAVPA